MPTKHTKHTKGNQGIRRDGRLGLRLQSEHRRQRLCFATAAGNSWFPFRVFRVFGGPPFAGRLDRECPRISRIHTNRLSRIWGQPSLVILPPLLPAIFTCCPVRCSASCVKIVRTDPNGQCPAELAPQSVGGRKGSPGFHDNCSGQPRMNPPSQQTPIDGGSRMNANGSRGAAAVRWIVAVSQTSSGASTLRASLPNLPSAKEVAFPGFR